MCSAFNKYRLSIYTLLALLLSLPNVHAETGVVNLTGSGKDPADAMASVLRVSVTKNFKGDAAFVKSVLQNEISPNASSFVQSYRVVEGGNGKSFVSISASVDLDVIRSLLSLTAKNLGEPEGAKALLVIRGAKLPGLVPPKPGAPLPNPFHAIEVVVKDRLARRQFQTEIMSQEELSSVNAGDDTSSPELLRGIGSRAEARIAVGFYSRLEAVENENTHSEEERIFLYCTIVDVKNGTILARVNSNFLNPKSRKEVYAADIQRVLLEEARDLMQDALVSAGRSLFKSNTQDKMSIVRIMFPSNPGLVNKFRTLLEGVKEIKKVSENEIQRGSFDLSIHPALEPSSLTKIVKNLNSEEITISILKSSEMPSSNKTIDLYVKLEPKTSAQTVDTGEGEKRE